MSVCASVADSGAASSQCGCGLWDGPQARDVFSTSDFTLKAQLCKWLTAYIQNVQCRTKRRSPRHWVCAMITCQRANATHTLPPLCRGGSGKEYNCRKENSEAQFDTLLSDIYTNALIPSAHPPSCRTRSTSMNLFWLLYLLKSQRSRQH